MFRDRQTFLLPEMPPSANPAEQLNARIEEQKRLLDKMRRTPGSDAAAREKLMRQQREIREKTPSKTGSPLPGETARHLERAENAMKESENMLRSGRSSMAQTAAQKALADLKRAAGEIDVNGDRKMQRSLSAAQREMERLAGRSGKGVPHPHNRRRSALWRNGFSPMPSTSTGPENSLMRKHSPNWQNRSTTPPPPHRQRHSPISPPGSGRSAWRGATPGSSWKNASPPWRNSRSSSATSPDIRRLSTRRQERCCTTTCKRSWS
ncbi:MAG: hypothetical protein L6W00_02625 [Lentisphaeria bacterium]|nr:MAG: hypothetical protein L6W00_02625 [Lentisphaeria bacterium]